MNLITGRNGSERPNMARRPRGHEKILMRKKRFGYFPQQFIWRGRRYDVQAVERCWTVSRRRLGNKVDRLCFRVRCAARDDFQRRGIEGTFDLYQDLNSNTWHLEKLVAEA